MTPLHLIDRLGQHLCLPDDAAIAAQLLSGEAVHRELRPDMGEDYRGLLELLFNSGALITHLIDEGEVRALAVWRVFETTYCGRRFEIDDLVTAAAHRSSRYGATLLGWLEDQAQQLGCSALTLNSAVHRRDAHRFYFRQGYGIFGFHFTKQV